MQAAEQSVIETGSGVLLDPATTDSPPLDSVQLVTKMEDIPTLIQTEEETLVPVAIKVRSSIRKVLVKK